MQNEIIHTDQSDVFSENIKQKLENFELPVDAVCWDEIEARLTAKKKKKIIPFWWWLTGGAAVASLILLLTIRTNTESSIYISKSTLKQTHKTTIHQIKNSESHIQNSTIALTNRDIKNLPSTHNKLIENIPSKQENQLAKNEIIQFHFTTPDSTVESDRLKQSELENHPKPQLAQTETSIKDTIIHESKKKPIPTTLKNNFENEPIAKTKSKGEWLLAANLGSGGSTSLGGSSGLLMTSNGNKDLTTASSNYTNILTTNDFTQKNYLPPVSFGLTIRKKLDKSISIETGLVYTYLLSTFEKDAIIKYNARLKLHYLGIPLNLVAKIWNNPKWEIYVSGGPMVEKGLQSVYIQNEHFGNQTITTTAKTKIDGLQWSLNGAAGVTYKLQHNWGIYFEPKISYFFDNNQPVSSRTENPFVIGLNAGLRFQF